MMERDGLVLIVDDDQLSRVLLQTILQETGIQVVMSVGGPQALLVLEKEPVDVILLDLVMPEMDGFEVLARLKNNGRLRHIPVIVVSAIDDVDSLLRCIELGAADYLTKPFNPALLRARVKASLAAKRLHDVEEAATRAIRVSETEQRRLYEEQRRMTERQTTLYNLLRLVSRRLEPLSVVETAVQNIIESTGWSNVAIALPDFKEQVLVIVASGGPLAPALQLKLKMDEGIVGRAYQQNQIHYVPDVRTDAEYVMGHPLIRSEIAVPIIYNQVTMGILNLESDQIDFFDEADIRLAESLAGAIGLALHNARLHEAIAEKHVQFEALTHMMVHDLRSPLASINMALELMAVDHQQLPPALAEPVRIARRNTLRLIDLVNAILDVNRLESGSVALNLELVALRPLVDDILQLQGILANEKELSLINEIAPAVPLIRVDESLLRRVFENLISNAIKFTPAGGHIWIRAQVIDESNGEAWVQVSVADSGLGIPGEIQEKLFQKFVTGPQHARGSGLGLAFCRLVVEAHGGDIWAEQAPGQGAVFKFTLPVAEFVRESS